MKRIGLLLILVFQLGFGQTEQNNKVKFKGNFGLELKSNYYFGDNYLAKGHKNPAIGFAFNWNFLEYKKFKLGVSFEKNTLQVIDYSIGGFIDKSNITVYNSNLSYQIPINAKLALEPSIFYGQLFIKQKNGSKNYGVQNGNDLGIGVCLNYRLNKSIQVYSNVALSHYFLTANTSQEFENYFNSSNSLSLSLGCKFF
jgi:hypothetical protein